jgi:hypothetical protein
LEWVEAAGGARVFLEDDRVLDPGLVHDEVLSGGRLLVDRHPLVVVRHRGLLSSMRYTAGIPAEHDQGDAGCVFGAFAVAVSDFLNVLPLRT